MTRTDPTSAPSPVAVDAFNRGNIALQDNDPGTAVAAYREATELSPTFHEAWANLGSVLAALGDQQAAETALRQAVALAPNAPLARYALAHTLINQGRPADAISELRVAHTSEPAQADIAELLAALLMQAEEWRPAFTVVENALAAGVSSAHLLTLHGQALLYLGRPDTAIDSFERSLALDPNGAHALSFLGRALAELGKAEEARTACMRAAELAPKDPTIQLNLGRSYELNHEDEKAADIYDALLAANPGSVETLINRANVAKRLDDYDAAEAFYWRAITAKPTSSIAWHNYGDLLLRLARHDEAVEAYRTCCSVGPPNPYFFSDYIFALHYNPEFDAEALRDAIHDWPDRYGPFRRRVTEPFVNERDPDRRLRIGLISGSFRQHPIAFLGLAGFEALDERAFELICYANQTGSGDVYTRRFQGLAAAWHDVAYLSDDALEHRVRNDRIDIIIELSGHGAGHRLPAVARRMAPIQIKWVGGQYNSMGIETIDAFLSDAVESPPEDDALYTERIVRLPNAYACFEPRPDMPDPGALPMKASGQVTFGSLNKINKLNAVTVDLWSRVLDAVPGSRLLLKTEVLDAPAARRRVDELFSARGIAADRLDLRGFDPHPTVFQTYREIDIALDPTPYSGCLTTLEALWMGVPVVTLPGWTFAGRHSASFLTCLGLEALIAADADDYIQKVVALASDQNALAALRSDLRPRMVASPLCDRTQFSADFGAALRSLWRDWCRGSIGAQN